ncbi:hypothetical protein S83_012419, partial [Arachis hypogaea]
EVLFELGGFQIVRGVFISLAPPYTPHPDLINTSAMIASLKAMRNKAARIWYFPYDFATAVLADAPISQLQNSSEGRWMPQTENLEHLSLLFNKIRCLCQFGKPETPGMLCCWTLRHRKYMP